MKGHMTSHIDRTRWTMFHESTNKVKQALEDLMKLVEQNMLARADEVFLSVKRDYSSALIGSQAATGRALPREQRVVRKEVLEMVSESEKTFKRLVGFEPEEDEQGYRGQDPKLEPSDYTTVTSGPLTPFKSESQNDGGSQHCFEQLKAEDEDQEHTSSTSLHTVDQQHSQPTEPAADLLQSSSDVSAVDDLSAENSTDDESAISSSDEGRCDDPEILESISDDSD